MGDGLNMLDRVGEPERQAPAEPPKGQVIRFVVDPLGIVDTSGPGPVMLQQPSRWTHDFDPDTGESRAHLPAVVPIFANPPAAPTPPPGTSDTSVATTEFVAQAMREAVEEAIVKARIGAIDGFPARPGDIGEHLQITVPPPGNEMQPSSVWVVTSLDLPPGDWDLSATVGYSITGSLPPMPVLEFIAALAPTPSFPGFPNQGGTTSITATAPATGNITLPLFQRVLTATDQTMFLLAYCVFSSPVRVYGFGYLSARRRR